MEISLGIIGNLACHEASRKETASVKGLVGMISNHLLTVVVKKFICFRFSLERSCRSEFILRKITTHVYRKHVAMSRPQIRQQLANPPSTGRQKERQQKRPTRPFDDEDDEDAFSILRKMTRYNPSKYHNDDDDSDTEVDFAAIQREEQRSCTSMQVIP